MGRKRSISYYLNTTVLGTAMLVGGLSTPFVDGLVSSVWADDSLEITVTGTQSTAAASSMAKNDSAFGRLRPRPYDEIFLNELLDRGLSRLAQKHCEERLASAKDVPPAQLAEWNVELIRVLSERALLKNGAEQEELWKQAEKIRTDYAAANPNSPWQVLLDYQWTVGQLSYGEQLVLLAEDASGSEVGAGSKASTDSEKMQAAREVLRQVIERLETMGDTLQNTTSTTSSSGSKPRAKAKSKSKKTADQASSDDGLTLWEAVLLQDKIRFQLLRAFQIQGETYPPESVDRTNSIQQALQQVKTLSVLPNDSPLLLNVRLSEIACLRLLEDVTQAKKRIETMELHTLPTRANLRLTAEKIQLAILQGNLQESFQLTADLPSNVLGQCGELDCAILELHLAQWTQALTQKNATEAEKWSQQSQAVLADIRKHSTPWWTRKAEILFQRSLAMTAAGGDLAVLTLRAESACRTGNLEKAVAACELLWQKALEQKNTQTALKCSTVMASLAYREKDIPLAIQWFRRPAKAFPQEPDAVKSHHHAIALAAQEVQRALQTVEETELAQNEPLNKTLDTYEALLIEHVRQFLKTDPAILDTLNRLENLLKLRHKWNSAVDVAMITVAKTPDNSEAYAQALTLAMTDWDLYLQNLASQKSEKLTVAVQSVLKWGKTQKLAPTQALKLAEWQLNYTPESTAEAAQLLQNLLDTADVPGAQNTLTEDERGTTLCFLILAKLSQGNSEDLEQLLQEVAGASAGQTDTLLTICRRLNRLLAQQPTPETKRKLAGLELQVCQILEKDRAKFPPETQRELERISAEALLLTDNHAEAFARYESMAKQFPNRRDIQTTWGRLLLEEGIRTRDQVILKRALDQWREIEKRTPKQTPEWFEAKYRVAFLYKELGDLDKAVKIVKTLRVLYPEMGGAEWKTKFEEILQPEK